VEERVFQSGNTRSLGRVRPNPGDLLHVYLAVYDNVRSRGGQMTVHPRTNAFDGLPDVNRNAVKVAQYIAANFVGPTRADLKQSQLRAGVVGLCPTLVLQNLRLFQEKT
jgi:hypothetical protein